jgi:acyl-CoA thioester hydrolase
VDGYVFSTDVAVRFAETDAQGIVHHAVYLVWFELARVEYLERYAGGYQSIRDRGFEALTLEAHVAFRRPARFGERVRVHARCGDLRGARFRYDYVIERDGETLVDGWTAHAMVDGATFAPTRVPQFLTDAIAAAESSSRS